MSQQNYTVEELESLSRRELQKLAKRHSVKANQKSVVLVSKLSEILCQPSDNDDDDESTADSDAENNANQSNAITTLQTTANKNSDDATCRDPSPPQPSPPKLNGSNTTLSYVSESENTSAQSNQTQVSDAPQLDTSNADNIPDSIAIKSTNAATIVISDESTSNHTLDTTFAYSDSADHSESSMHRNQEENNSVTIETNVDNTTLDTDNPSLPNGIAATDVDTTVTTDGPQSSSMITQNESTVEETTQKPLESSPQSQQMTLDDSLVKDASEKSEVEVASPTMVAMELGVVLDEALDVDLDTSMIDNGDSDDLNENNTQDCVDDNIVDLAIVGIPMPVHPSPPVTDEQTRKETTDESQDMIPPISESISTTTSPTAPSAQKNEEDIIMAEQEQEPSPSIDETLNEAKQLMSQSLSAPIPNEITSIKDDEVLPQDHDVSTLPNPSQSTSSPSLDTGARFAELHALHSTLPKGTTTAATSVQAGECFAELHALHSTLPQATTTAATSVQAGDFLEELQDLHNALPQAATTAATSIQAEETILQVESMDIDMDASDTSPIPKQEDQADIEHDTLDAPKEDDPIRAKILAELDDRMREAGFDGTKMTGAKYEKEQTELGESLKLPHEIGRTAKSKKTKEFDTAHEKVFATGPRGKTLDQWQEEKDKRAKRLLSPAPTKRRNKIDSTPKQTSQTAKKPRRARRSMSQEPARATARKKKSTSSSTNTQAKPVIRTKCRPSRRSMSTNETITVSSTSTTRKNTTTPKVKRAPQVPRSKSRGSIRITKGTAISAIPKTATKKTTEKPIKSMRTRDEISTVKSAKPATKKTKRTAIQSRLFEGTASSKSRKAATTAQTNASRSTTAAVTPAPTSKSRTARKRSVGVSRPLTPAPKRRRMSSVPPDNKIGELVARSRSRKSMGSALLSTTPRAMPRKRVSLVGLDGDDDNDSKESELSRDKVATMTGERKRISSGIASARKIVRGKRRDWSAVKPKVDTGLKRLPGKVPIALTDEFNTSDATDENVSPNTPVATKQDVTNSTIASQKKAVKRKLDRSETESEWTATENARKKRRTLSGIAMTTKASVIRTEE